MQHNRSSIYPITCRTRLLSTSHRSTNSFRVSTFLANQFQAPDWLIDVCGYHSMSIGFSPTIKLIMSCNLELTFCDISLPACGFWSNNCGHQHWLHLANLNHTKTQVLCSTSVGLNMIDLTVHRSQNRSIVNKSWQFWISEWLWHSTASIYINLINFTHLTHLVERNRTLFIPIVIYEESFISRQKMIDDEPDLAGWKYALS